jgi:glycosyltransferase involved in cell wall biosynthesis
MYDDSFYPGYRANTIVNSVNSALVNSVNINRRDGMSEAAEMGLGGAGISTGPSTCLSALNYIRALTQFQGSAGWACALVQGQAGQRIVNHHDRLLSNHDIMRLRERVEAIQTELAGLHRELAEPANGRFLAGYWSALLDLWARLRKPIKLYCDYPADGAEAHVGNIVHLRGWALGQTGISAVEIQIDDYAPVQVSYGKERLDLRDAFPGIPKAENSGFDFEWDTQGCAPGRHEIQIRARSFDGHRAHLRRRITLRRLADFQVFCDEPAGAIERSRGSKLVIRGWCAAKSPIVRVEFGIDDGPVTELAYGRSRPEVHKIFPEYPIDCGFQCETSGLAPGEHRLTIAARTRAGDSAVLRQNFFVRSTEDDVRLYCDYPVTRGCQSVRDVVQFRGWAVAWSGIEQVTVQIGNMPPSIASFGLPRPDVARTHPDFSGAERCGWRFFWDTAAVPEGRYEVRITATALAGFSSTITMALLVDQTCDPEYSHWIAENEPTQDDKEAMAAEIGSFERRPKISIVVPVYKTPLDLLARCIDSVLAQIYSEWELCLADDGSNDPQLTELLESYRKRDPRIRVATLEKNLGISGATNAALRMCTGGYIGFLDSDDELADFAVWETVKAINEDPLTDLFYSDEDKIDEKGRRYDWFFKPEWSPELFFSCNYLCHFIVIRRWVFDRVKRLDESYRGGTQDYEFLLRVIECTTNIKRIPKILYHWRAIEGSSARTAEEKPGAGLNGQRALSEYMSRNHPGATVDQVASCRYRVHYPIEASPGVDIIISAGGKMDLLRRAVEDIVEKTSYKAFEIVLIDNSSKNHVEQYAHTMASSGAPIRYIDWRHRRFNFSAMNNEAVRQSTAPYVLFLNDDTSIVTREWLSAMLEHAQRPEIGAVGAQLWYPHDTIQHAGVVMGIYGNSGHAFRTLPVTPLGLGHYYDYPWLTRNCCAVTAACMLVGRSKFWQAHGFNEENLSVAFSDVDLCLNLLKEGYRNVYTPYAILYHYESATKAEKRTEVIPNPVEDHFMKRKWKRYIENDPYYSPNLTRGDEHYHLRLRS